MEESKLLEYLKSLDRRITSIEEIISAQAVKDVDLMEALGKDIPEEVKSEIEQIRQKIAEDGYADYGRFYYENIKEE